MLDSYQLVTSITGIAVLLMSLIFKKYPPKSINSIYGYRTPSSMKSKERWDFAQQYSAHQMMIYSISLILMSAVGFIHHFDEHVGLGLGIIIVLICLLAPILKTEAALKRKFGKE